MMVTEAEAEPVVVVVPPDVPPVVPPVPDDRPALAVTVASTDVVSVVDARPAASVMIDDAPSVPAVVVKITGTEASGLPFTSVTAAETVAVPPVAGIVVGLAPRTMRPTAAAPTAMRRLRSPVDVEVPPVVVVVPPLPEVVAAPDEAAMIATPLEPPARKVTVARPLASVLTSLGSIVPSVVVKVTRVPLWGGVPDDSRTCAVIVADPFTASAVVAEVSEIDEPVGARNGVFSHAATNRLADSARATATD